MTSHSIETLLGPAEPAVFIESEVEDEVDQLDSDTDAESPTPDQATTKKGTSARPGIRLPGHSLLPQVKLENIIHADGVTGNLALSKEGLFILSAATEEFIKRMAQAGHRQASSQRRNAIHYSDMAATTQQYQEFMFLNDTIPSSIPLTEALQLREAKERETLEDDPAMTATMHPTPPPMPSGFSSTVLKIKHKAHSTNGTEKLNGKSSANLTASERQFSGRSELSQGAHDAADQDSGHDDDEPWQSGHGEVSTDTDYYRRPKNGSTPTPISKSPLANGHSTSVSRSGTLTPSGTRNPSPPRESHSRSPPQAPWDGQYTGPASGFLQGPGGPFSRPPQNPGRTIYSQSHSPD